MGAARRVLSAVAVATACIVLWACGDEQTSGAVPAPAGGGTRSGLGTERFQALDALFVASLPLDAFTDGEDVDATRRGAADDHRVGRRSDRVIERSELAPAVPRGVWQRLRLTRAATYGQAGPNRSRRLVNWSIGG